MLQVSPPGEKVRTKNKNQIQVDKCGGCHFVHIFFFLLHKQQNNWKRWSNTISDFSQHLGQGGRNGGRMWPLVLTTTRGNGKKSVLPGKVCVGFLSLVALFFAKIAAGKVDVHVWLAIHMRKNWDRLVCRFSYVWKFLFFSEVILEDFSEKKNKWRVNNRYSNYLKSVGVVSI